MDLSVIHSQPMVILVFRLFAQCDIVASSISVTYSRILQVVIHITDCSGFDGIQSLLYLIQLLVIACSEEDSSPDDPDLSDPEVGMHQYSSDSEGGCSEMDEGTLSFATSTPSAAHSTTLENVQVQSQE